MAFLFVMLNACTGQSYDSFESMLEDLYAYTVPHIHPDSLQADELQDHYVIIDTRAKKEFEVSHIQGAIHIPYRQSPKDFYSHFDTDKPIIVYCSVGYRSELFGERVQKHYPELKVYNLYGGIFNWVNSGLPIYNPNQQQTENIHPYNKSWGKWLTKGTPHYGQ